MQHRLADLLTLITDHALLSADRRR